MSMIAILVASFLGLPALAADDCNNIKLKQVPSTTGMAGSPSITFRVERKNKKGCDFYVTCSNNNSLETGSFADRSLEKGADSIPVQLCKDSDCTVICKTRTQGSATEVLTGTFPDGVKDPEFATFTIYPRLGTLDYPRFGFYQQKFELRLYLGAFSSNDERDHESITLTYDVAKAIDLSIVETGAPYNAASVSRTLNFGPLTTNAQRSADLLLKFNAGYRIRLKTTNAGHLKRENGAQLISYGLTVNGAPASLTTNFSNVLSGTGTSVAGGQRFPVVVTVGNVPAGQAPGTYKDDVTIQVESTE